MNARGLSAIITIAKYFDEGELLRIMNSTNGIITVFAGSASRPFAQKMCDYLGVELGKSTTHIFSEGGIYVRADESIRNKDVYIVQSIGKDPNNAFTELIFWIDAFKRASANSITAIIPYFGYAKADKKDEPRVSIRARVCADCIEMCGADRVVTMDLHAAQVQGFFSKPVDHLYASALLCEYARHLGIVNENLVVVSPDAGSAKRARAYANILGCNVAIGDKVRIGHDENPNALEIIGDVKGKTCMVVDDFTISGNTLCKVAYGLMDKGAKEFMRSFPMRSSRRTLLSALKKAPSRCLSQPIPLTTPMCLKIQRKSKLFPPRRCLRKPCAPFMNVNPWHTCSNICPHALWK